MLNKKEKILISACTVLATIAIAIGVKEIVSYQRHIDKIKGVEKPEDISWKEQGFDTSLPILNQDGWYMVFEDDFNGDALNQGIRFGERYAGNEQIWSYSPHALRWKSDNPKQPNHACYWCPNMVEVKDSNLIIHSRYENNHTCDGDCPKKARFTGGIETVEHAKDENGKSKSTTLFSQAFGYYECRVKLPDVDGLWSAFWLQSNNQGKVGNEGQDGTEIDIFESAFRTNKSNRMGNALLWDGYQKQYAKVADHIFYLDSSLYDGNYHTFALKWTPEYYVFYVDNIPHWATDAGDVSKVKEFLRLTVEIDAGDMSGPHGQYIGKFHHYKQKNSDFLVDYVKVWQNEQYEQFVKEDSEYQDTRNS